MSLPLGSPKASTSADQRRPTVVLVGPRTESHGGIAATLHLLECSKLRDEFRLIMVSTYRDGGAVDKVLEAAHGLSRLATLCLRGRVDLVHVHLSSGASLARKSLAIAVARASRTPVMVHVHSGRLAAIGTSSSRGPWNSLQRRAFRWALKSADMVVALSPSFERIYSVIAPMRRSCVIPNAAAFSPSTSAPLSGSKKLVLFLGHLYADKGVYDLLEAFTIIASTDPEARLVLAGEGPEYERLRERADQLGLEGVVDLPGWVGSPSKEDLLSSAACLVLPSHTEGVPLALLEAMMSGVPIVATAVGGIPDVVQHEIHALLVPPHNVRALVKALIRVLDEPTLASMLSDAARTRALAEYTPDTLVQRVRTAYAQVLRGTT